MATILTVDDSISMRKIIAATLHESGHCVVEASDGEDALQMIREGEQFDLIVTDMNMPKVDGITFLKALRKMDSFKDTPVLFLTTEMDAETKEAAKAAGATGWIVKPFSPISFLATIEKVLGSD